MFTRTHLRRLTIGFAAAVLPLGLFASASLAQAASGPRTADSLPPEVTTQAPAEAAAAAAAPAAEPAATTYRGRITASPALIVRKAPTTYAPRVTSLANGTVVSIQCKVYGPTVSGNKLWYKLSTGRWVTARYVANIGTAPRFCGPSQDIAGRVNSATSLAVRSGPHTSDTRVTSASSGATIWIVCKVDSQSIGGNTRWYMLTSEGGPLWVSARYVTNTGGIPPYC